MVRLVGFAHARAVLKLGSLEIVRSCTGQSSLSIGHKRIRKFLKIKIVHYDRSRHEVNFKGSTYYATAVTIDTI